MPNFGFRRPFGAPCGGPTTPAAGVARNTPSGSCCATFNKPSGSCPATDVQQTPDP